MKKNTDIKSNLKRKRKLDFSKIEQAHAILSRKKINSVKVQRELRKEWE
jgi:hypothetical protein